MFSMPKNDLRFQDSIKTFCKENSSRIIFAVSLLVVILNLLVIISRAWVSDDSYITFRVVENLHAGHGFRWNISERVQVFSHPLWMLFISFLFTFTKEVYLTSMFLGVLLSAGVFVIFLLQEKSNPAIWVGLVALGFSNAFVDYSTSGLENSLSHFLMIIFLVLYSNYWNNPNKSILPMTLLSGLLCLNRLDYLLLFFPFYLYILIREKNRLLIVRDIFIGFMPLLLWLGFSAIYYGFPLPNTFYAKVGNWLPRQDLLLQGWAYCKRTFYNDPVTGITIITGITLSVLRPSRERILITLGAISYILYVVWIGGDFMQGRFFTIIFLIFVLQLIHYDLAMVPGRFFVGILFGLLFFNFLSTNPTIAPSSWTYVETWEDGIVNERFFYADETALLRNGKFNLAPAHPWMYEGDVMRRACIAQNNCYFAQNSVGFSGYYAGPDVYIVDRYGLTSALMARIPPEITPEWRIGHFLRKVPSGYLEYLSTGDLTKVKEVQIHDFITDLEVITDAKVLDGNRIKTVIEFWTGANHYPSDDN
jgi:arabinofuranosyltransferase